MANWPCLLTMWPSISTGFNLSVDLAPPLPSLSPEAADHESPPPCKRLASHQDLREGERRKREGGREGGREGDRNWLGTSERQAGS